MVRECDMAHCMFHILLNDIFDIQLDHVFIIPHHFYEVLFWRHPPGVCSQ